MSKPINAFGSVTLITVLHCGGGDAAISNMDSGAMDSSAIDTAISDGTTEASSDAGPSDLQVSASGVLDPEFEIYSNRYTYCTRTTNLAPGKLWVGTFAADGSFADFNAQQGAPLDDCLFQINGPEWGHDNTGSVISYVKTDTAGNPTLAYVHEDSPAFGAYTIGVVPNLPALPSMGNAVYPSDAPNPSAKVYFVTTTGVDWRDLAGGTVPGAGGDVVSTDQGFWRWATQSNFIAFVKTVGSVKQLFAQDTSTGTSTQVSTDDGDKSTPHMWIDATWGMVASAVVGNNCQVYQYPSGTKVLTIPSPNGAPMQSLEHFVYQGHSYIYYFVTNDVGSTKNNDVYVSSVTPNFKHLKTSGSQLMKRIEPEVSFPSPGTPIIFFSADGADGKPNAVWRSAIVDLP